MLETWQIERLERFASRSRHHQRVVDAITTDGGLGSTFQRERVSAERAGVKVRHLVGRILVRADTRFEPFNPTANQLSHLLYYLEHHSARPLGSRQGMRQLMREDIPRAWSFGVAGDRVGGSAFLRNLILEPYFRHRAAESAFPQWPALDSFDWSSLAGSVDQLWRVAQSDVLRHLNGEERLDGADVLFDSGHPQVDLPNALTFLEAFMKHGQGSDTQDRLPRPLSRRLCIPELSVVHLVVAADVIGLHALGLIDPEAPPGPLSSVLRGLEALYETQAHAHLRDKAAQLFLQTLMTEHRSAAHIEERQQGVLWLGRYGSTLLFNSQRLVTHAAGVQQGVGIHYQGINREALQQVLAGHVKEVAPEREEWLRTRVDHWPEALEPLDMRSLTNGLLHVMWQAEQGYPPSVALPSVGRYFFGAPDRASNASRQPTREDAPRRRPKSGLGTKQEPLPLLEQALSPRGRSSDRSNPTSRRSPTPRR